jgi:hypothetical protein
MKTVYSLLTLLLIATFTRSQEIKWDGELRISSEMYNRDFEILTPCEK